MFGPIGWLIGILGSWLLLFLITGALDRRKREDEIKRESLVPKDDRPFAERFAEENINAISEFKNKYEFNNGGKKSARNVLDELHESIRDKYRGDYSQDEIDKMFYTALGNVALDLENNYHKKTNPPLIGNKEKGSGFFMEVILDSNAFMYLVFIGVAAAGFMLAPRATYVTMAAMSIIALYSFTVRTLSKRIAIDIDPNLARLAKLKAKPDRYVFEKALKKKINLRIMGGLSIKNKSQMVAAGLSLALFAVSIAGYIKLWGIPRDPP